jgi:hypothetical protein
VPRCAEFQDGPRCSIDQNGDLDRESFIIKVVNGKQQVIATVPAAGAKN